MKYNLYYNAKIDPQPHDVFIKPWEIGRYRALESSHLVQKGDQYLMATGQFQQVPLDAIGTFPPAGVLIRRPL